MTTLTRTAPPLEPLTERAHLLTKYLDVEAATGIEGAQWEAFHISHLNDDAGYRSENKARQIGWSWIIAAEAVAFALLRDPIASSSVFESINQKEAQQKIDYARMVYEALRPQLGAGWPRVTKETNLMLEFDGGIAEGGSVLESLPAIPPRGKSKRNFYGDEFAHVKRDREIYKGALPVTSKGGRMRLGSSPLGPGGMFHDIFTETTQRYPGYRRKTTPWWKVFFFCKDVVEAMREAETMSTAERVYRWGRDAIIQIFENMILEDFQQEYECAFASEADAWITWDEIKDVQDPALVSLVGHATPGDLADAIYAIQRTMQLVSEGAIERVFYAGFDVGRKKNPSELFLVGKGTTDQLALRLNLRMDKLPFDDQQDLLEAVITKLPVVKMLIDQTGLGMQLAEHMKRRYSAKVEPVTFSAPMKQLWATTMKMKMQQHKLVIPVDRDLALQIHSIKKIITTSKNVVLDTERTDEHHADKFWGLALATTAADTRTKTVLPGMGVAGE